MEHKQLKGSLWLLPRIVFAVLVSSVLTGCSIGGVLEPLVPHGFIYDHDLRAKDDSLPFQHSWVAAPDFQTRYTEIMIEPVTSQYLNSEQWLESVSLFVRSRDKYQHEVDELTAFANRYIPREFRKNDSNRLKLVTTPSEHTLVLEIAFTEVVLGDPLAHAGTSFLPILFGSQIFSAMRNPEVAFEAIVRDGGTGIPIATFADRRFPQVRVVDLNKFTLTSPNREIIEYWAEQLVRTLNKKPKEVVEERFPMTLKFW